VLNQLGHNTLEKRVYYLSICWGNYVAGVACFRTQNSALLNVNSAGTSSGKFLIFSSTGFISYKLIST